MATTLQSLTFLTGEAARAKKAFAAYEAIAEGVHFARDLVNEPANKLYSHRIRRPREGARANQASRSRS